MSRRVFILLVLTGALGSVGPALGAEPQWPAMPYKYVVIDQDIRSVLVEFGRNVGVSVDLSDQIKGRMRGRLAVATVREFLDELCNAYGLVWYFDGASAVLHVSAKAETRTELINIGQLSPEEASARLIALGVGDARFPVRSTPDSGIVSVSGPPPFVSLVRQTLAAFVHQSHPVREDSHGDEIKVRVFRGGAAILPSGLSLANNASREGLGAMT
jgi:type III secretion protein C